MLRITVILLQINKITLEKNENPTKVLTENCFFFKFSCFFSNCLGANSILKS